MSPLVALAIQELPDIIGAFKQRFAAANPADPPLTDAQVAQALAAAVLSSLAKDDDWLSAHPEG